MTTYTEPFQLVADTDKDGENDNSDERRGLWGAFLHFKGKNKRNRKLSELLPLSEIWPKACSAPARGLVGCSKQLKFFTGNSTRESWVRISD